MAGSKRFNINEEEIMKWARNALLFAAPALVIFLTELQAGHSFDEAFIALKVWAMSTAIDFLRKYLKDNPE